MAHPGKCPTCQVPTTDSICPLCKAPIAGAAPPAPYAGRRPPTTADPSSPRRKRPGTVLDQGSPKHTPIPGGPPPPQAVAPVYAAPPVAPPPAVPTPAPRPGGTGRRRPRTDYKPAPGGEAFQGVPGAGAAGLFVSCPACLRQKSADAPSCPSCGALDPRVHLAARSPQRATPSGARLAGWLVTFTHNPLGEDYRITEGRSTVGRGPECDIHVPSDPALSGHHASLFIEGDVCRLKDEGSMGGTLVNGRKVWADAADLPARAELSMGGTTFTFIRAFPPESDGHGS